MMDFHSVSPEQINFPTGYESIINRINQVDPVAYGQTRNYVDGSVTYLSPYISRGVISVKQVHDAVLERGFEPHAITRFLQELAWREYFQRVWQSRGDLISGDLTQAQPDFVHRGMIAAVESATTGVHAVDEAIRNLNVTGYMHNHLRMYVASICCNIGKAHWSMPANWMYYHLLDGDVASNSCSWQWVAGAFSKKKYYCNQENINRFTRTFQQHTFLDTPVDLLSAIPVPPELAATKQLKLETQLPLSPVAGIDITKPTLIYNSYNLDPLWRKTTNANRVLLLEPSHFRHFPVSEKVIEFVLAVAVNIPGIKVITAEFSELEALYKNSDREKMLISKEHPAFRHYSGVRDERDWIFPEVTQCRGSFFRFWKQCVETTKARAGN